MAFNKGNTENGLFFDIPELDTSKLDNYDGFYIPPAVGPFGPSYIYATTHHLIYISLYIAAILPAAYTIASLVCYCINGLYIRNCPVDVKKLRKFFLLEPDNIAMKTLGLQSNVLDSINVSQ